MKSIFCFVLLLFSLQLPPLAAQPVSGQIDIYPDQSRTPISPLIFGLGVEWIDNGNGILDPKTGAIRSDVVAELLPLRIPVFRFPGGILADYYNWQDGVGPRRPQRQNPMDGTTHSNAFGTDEFISLCSTLGSSALITANVGTGNLNQTLLWQKYFASKNLPVKYWEIGNEIYLTEPNYPGSIPGNDSRIYKTSNTYASAFKSWSQALHAADPNTLVGAVGGLYNVNSYHYNWLTTLLSTAAPSVDFLAIHNSFAPVINESYDLTTSASRATIYSAMYSQPQNVSDEIDQIYIKLKSFGAPQQVAVTEHFPLFGGSPTQSIMLNLIDQTRTQGSALFTASLLHFYMREKVFMANYNLTLSQWFGALLTDTPGGLVETPTYHVYNLFRNHFGDTLISSQAQSPTYSTQQLGNIPTRGGVPVLDTVAATDGAGKRYLSVINKGTTYQDVRLAAGAPAPGATVEVWGLSASTADTINGTPLSPTTLSGHVTPVQSFWTVSTPVYRFPANSITILKW